MRADETTRNFVAGRDQLARFQAILCILLSFVVIMTKPLVPCTVRNREIKLSRFLPRDTMHKRDLCRHAVSIVCLCVCHVRGSCQDK